LHVNLQRQIINYFKQQNKSQFLIATHSEEFIKSVDIKSILSVLSGKPRRIESGSAIISALSEIDNIDIVRTQESPYILYLEGEDDERILSAWANTLNETEVYQQFYAYVLGGSTKEEMKKKADNHFKALKQIVPILKRAVILDYDNEDVAIIPPLDQCVMNEWKRKNIDNYLLIPDAWKRAVAAELKDQPHNLFFSHYNQLIDKVFLEQNLFLPQQSQWKTLKAQIFSIIDGKKLLFENPDSLFLQIKAESHNILKINRPAIASAMIKDEIHEDIVRFFENLGKILKQ